VNAQNPSSIPIVRPGIEQDAGSRPRNGRPSLKSGEGVKFEKAITVNRPLAEVFAFWRDWENLPLFMKHVLSVRALSENTYHWTAQNSTGEKIEWDVQVTYLFVPEMRRRGRGKILNTASIAGFEPGPLLATYHASKAFVLSWSEAIATELEETGITVTALCPGATDTDFFPKAGMVNTRAFQKGKVMAPQEVAKIGYEALMRGDRTVIAGGVNKALVWARRFMSEGAQAKKNQAFYKDAKPAARKRHRGDVERKAATAS